MSAVNTTEPQKEPEKSPYQEESAAIAKCVDALAALTRDSQMRVWLYVGDYVGLRNRGW